MWWIRHTEAGYYANVVEYRAKISIQPTVHKSLNSTNIFFSCCLEHVFGSTDTSCVSQLLKNALASKEQKFDYVQSRGIKLQ